MADLTGKLRRTQIMNYSLKKGSLVGNALGSVAVSYCAIHTLLGYSESKSTVRRPTQYDRLAGLEKEEEAKSIIAGTCTGLLFKSTSGSLAKFAKGGLVCSDITHLRY